MKKTFLVFLLLLVAVGAFCKSKKKTEKTETPSSPVWMTDEGRLSVFPSSQYLSAFAFGGTPDAANNKAAEQLSEFIKSHITSSVNYSLSNDDYSVSQDSTVATDNLMYSTEYTTPYYSDYHGMYCVVAFIDRNKAFNYVKPKLDSAAKTFPSEYEQALLLEDDFDKVIAINKARRTLPAFFEVYDFARAVSPEKSKIYEQVELLAVQSESVLNQLKPKVVISVSVENDSDGRYEAALSDLFTKYGFTVTKKNASYQCNSIINLESQNKTAKTFEIHPAYSVEILCISDGNEVKMSCTHKLEKATGFDEATAKRRAALAIENDIKNKLIEEF